MIFPKKIQLFPDMAGEGDSAAIQANSANNQVCSQYLGGGGTEGEDCVGSAATSKLQTGAINGSYGASWAKENTAINLSFMEDDQANLIRRILHAKRTYSFPSSNDIHKVTVSSPPPIYSTVINKSSPYALNVVINQLELFIRSHFQF